MFNQVKLYLDWFNAGYINEIQLASILNDITQSKIELINTDRFFRKFYLG